MPAEITPIDTMVSAGGVVPWHGLGTIVDDPALDWEGVLALSGLAGWDLQKLPSYVMLPSGELQEVPGSFHITRTGVDNRVLGDVGDRYELFHNEELRVAHELVGGNGCMYQTAGSLRGGKIVWVLLETPFAVDLGGTEQFKTYLLITNRHDGWGSVTAAIVRVRVVCKNTLDMALGGAKAVVRIRHTKTMMERMGQAQQILGLTRGATERAGQIAEEMMRKHMAERAVNRIFEQLAKVPTGPDANKGAVTRATNKLDTLRSIYAQTPDLQDIKGTAWGVYQTIVQYNDHALDYRAGTYGAAENRMLAITEGDNIGTEALKLLGFGGKRTRATLATV